MKQIKINGKTFYRITTKTTGGTIVFGSNNFPVGTETEIIYRTAWYDEKQNFLREYRGR